MRVVSGVRSITELAVGVTRVGRWYDDGNEEGGDGDGERQRQRQ